MRCCPIASRFVIGDRDKLVFSPDGPPDLYIQADLPRKDKNSNWLPAPKEATFVLTMRIYSLCAETLVST